jgi:hypothetical protein
VWLFDLQVKELVRLKCAFDGCSTGENHDGSLWILNEYGYHRIVFLVEGFALYILVGCFLIVMRVTLCRHIWTSIWSLCIFQSHGCGFIHMVMGLFSWSRNQCISKFDLRVVIMPRYILYGCWVV